MSAWSELSLGVQDSIEYAELEMSLARLEMCASRLCTAYLQLTACWLILPVFRSSRAAVILSGHGHVRDQ